MKIKLKYTGYAILLLFLVIGVPIIINELYKLNTGYITIWGAEDVLSYYGTLSGATATIWVLNRTIKFTYSQIKYDRYIVNEEKKWHHIEELCNKALNSVQPIQLNYVYLRLLSSSPQHRLTPDFVKYRTDVHVDYDALLCNLSESDKSTISVFLVKLKFLLARCKMKMHYPVG